MIFYIYLQLITLCNCLTIYFLPLLRLSQIIGEFGGEKNEHLTQFSYLVAFTKENFSGLFFFWTSLSKEEFPIKQMINVATCLFACGKTISEQIWTGFCLLQMQPLKAILLKACVRYFLTSFYLSPNNIPSKTLKGVFISSIKLFSSSWYLSFCISIFHSFCLCQPLL